LALAEMPNASPRTRSSPRPPTMCIGRCISSASLVDSFYAIAGSGKISDDTALSGIGISAIGSITKIK
jgi:hypothetical protein